MNIDRTDPQTIYNAHAMPKSDFIDFYQLKATVEKQPKHAIQTLSSLWHDLRRKPKPSDIKRKSCNDDLAQTWIRPDSAADPNKTHHVDKPKSQPAEVPKKSNKALAMEGFNKLSRKEQVQGYLDAGITSPKEIAEKLNAYPSYISTIIKRLHGK